MRNKNTLISHISNLNHFVRHLEQFILTVFFPPTHFSSYCINNEGNLCGYNAPTTTLQLPLQFFFRKAAVKSGFSGHKNHKKDHEILEGLTSCVGLNLVSSFKKGAII